MIKRYSTNTFPIQKLRSRFYAWRNSFQNTNALLCVGGYQPFRSGRDHHILLTEVERFECGEAS